MDVGLTVRILGCCGSYPAAGAACSGYLVEGGGTRVWLDAGSGTMAELQRHVALTEVDAVVLSHEHPDHWSDFELFYVACRWGPVERRGVPVYAPPGLMTRAYHADQAPWFDWQEVTEADTIAVGGLQFRFSRTDHGPHTLAMRIESGGRALGYSADSGPGWSLEALGPGLDLALCEATFQKEQEGMAQHLSARQAGESARAAAVGGLLLTHVWPTLDPARSADEGSEAFGRQVAVARAGEQYEV